MRMNFWGIGACLLLLLLPLSGAAQVPQDTSSKTDSGYVLGPNDQIVLHAMDAPEISDKPFLIGTNGNLTLPLIDRVRAGGLTIEELEETLDIRLKKYLKNPQVAVTVVEFRSEPVSVIGAVSKPGIVQLRGRKTLYEVLSMAGGPTEAAGPSLTVTRHIENGTVPLPGAKTDATGQFSVADIDIQEILQGRNPGADIAIKPFDTISVSEAASNMIYVVGDVEHGGAFSLGLRQRLSVLKALSLAGGLGRTAKPDKARIIRGDPGELKPAEIAVNVKNIMNGRAEDVVLLPQDVLVIPTSSRKTFSTYSVPALVSAAAYGAIYHF